MARRTGSFNQSWSGLTLALALTFAGSAVMAQAALAPMGDVARLSAMDGAVSFAPAGAQAWSAASLNRPLALGDQLFTARGARAEVHLDANALRLGSDSALGVGALDGRNTQLQLTQGSLSIHVRELFDGQSLQVMTPNLSFAVSQPGEYRVDVDLQRATTRVAVRSGAGTVQGAAGVTPLAGGQQASFGSGGMLMPGIQQAAFGDELDRWASARDSVEDQSQSARYVPRSVVGYEQLDQYGSWGSDLALGAVWYPAGVAANWAPYTQGQWTWVDPLGWTWVDEARWGFAPFHYGRWARVGTRWGWVPGPRTQRPAFLAGNHPDGYRPHNPAPAHAWSGQQRQQGQWQWPQGRGPQGQVQPRVEWQQGQWQHGGQWPQRRQQAQAQPAAQPQQARQQPEQLPQWARPPQARAQAAAPAPLAQPAAQPQPLPQWARPPQTRAQAAAPAQQAQPVAQPEQLPQWARPAQARAQAAAPAPAPQARPAERPEQLPQWARPPQARAPAPAPAPAAQAQPESLPAWARPGDKKG